MTIKGIFGTVSSMDDVYLKTRAKADGSLKVDVVNKDGKRLQTVVSVEKSSNGKYVVVLPEITNGPRGGYLARAKSDFVTKKFGMFGQKLRVAWKTR